MAYVKWQSGEGNVVLFINHYFYYRLNQTSNRELQISMKLGNKNTK